MSDTAYEDEPLARGAGDWQGVVMIERPDVTKIPEGVEPMCTVMSARTVLLAGGRAICERLPYKLYAHLFQSDDGDNIICEAEFKLRSDGWGHLEVYGRSRCTLEDFFRYSAPGEQAAALVAAAKRDLNHRSPA